MAKLEREFQPKLIEKLEGMFEGCLITKLDSGYIQGIPDLLILHEDKWAILECKKSANAKRQPNQEYYVEKLDDMSFSRFVYPENEEQVLSELNEFFGESRRHKK